jgi:YfiH family protein
MTKLSLQTFFSPPSFSYVSCVQTHGTELFFVKHLEKPPHPTADGIITTTKNIPVGIRTADCMAITFFDKTLPLLCHIHAGFKGISQNMVQKTFLTLQQEYGVLSKNLKIISSPFIQVCCAKFSNPLRELPSFLHSYVHNFCLDMRSFVYDECLKNGVLSKNILLSSQCTCCHKKFPSYRRNKTQDRMIHIATIID